MPTDEQPSLGVITGLRRVGTKLIATASKVPAILREAIKAGRFTRTSAELNLKFHNSGWEKNLKSGISGLVLEACSLLGTSLPAVPNLASLDAYMSSPNTGERLVASFQPRSGPADNQFQNPDGTQMNIEDQGKILPGSSLHPVRQVGDHWEIHSRRGVVISRHATQASAMQEFRRLERDGTAHLSEDLRDEWAKLRAAATAVATYAETRNAELTHAMVVLRAAQPEEKRMDLDTVLSDDEAAYLAQNLGDRASQNIIQRAGERLTAALWHQQEARNGERVRL